jgi:hypothetical protein
MDRTEPLRASLRQAQYCTVEFPSTSGYIFCSWLTLYIGGFGEYIGSYKNTSGYCIILINCNN